MRGLTGVFLNTRKNENPNYMKYYQQKYVAMAFALGLSMLCPLATLADEAAPTQHAAATTAAKKTITGRITDKKGEELIGAVVRVNGTKTVVATDLEGNYSVSYSGKGNVTLSFSMLGYVTKTISATEANAGVLNVVLEEEAALLDEVVVVGYSTIKKESLTSAISNIKSEDISRSAAVNTSGALAGKVPGINSRQSDGRPGHWTTINIRNMGTPLYVVDGVQMDEGQFNNIDFNDIESISVLKDASASIYGVRAANGVVVVTTKSGKRNQKCRISLNTYYGWQSMFRYPELADAATYVKASTQATTLQGLTPKYSEEEYNAYVSGENPGFDWKKFIWSSSAPQWYAEISASGGSDKISYYVAASHVFQESMARNFGNFKRTNVQANIDADISDNFRVRARINGRVEDKKNSAFNLSYHGNDEYWTLFYAIVNNTPTQFPYANNNPLYPAMCGCAGYTNYANLTLDKAGEANDNWRVFQGNLEAEWEPLKGLVFKAMGSYFNSNERYKSRPKGYNLYSYDEGTDTYSVIKSYSGNFTNRWQYIETVNTQLSASYKNNWNDVHTLDAFVGFESYLSNNPGVSYYGIPAMDALKVAYFNELRSFNDWNENTSSRLGYMGRLNYEFKHRYLLEMSARYDGSWKFSPKHRWGFFPSVSAGWRASEESFWKDGFLGKYINNFKVRASYGILGDDNVSGYGAYDYMSGYNYNSGTAVLDGEKITTSSVRNLPQTEISWLKAHTLDVGIDVAVLNNRLSGSIDFFQRLRKGLPAGRYDVVVPSEVGFSWPQENLNSDMVRGFDATVTWTDKIQDFQYTVGGNITLAREFTWDQYKPTFTNSRNYYVYNQNHRYSGSSWEFNCIGQFQSWEEIAAYPVDIDGKGNSTLRPGDLIYEDVNQDGIITYDDQKPIGHKSYDGFWKDNDYRTPIINFNFNLGFEWKGIDFAADFAGMAYFTKYFNWEARFPFHGDGNTMQYYMGDQWHLADPRDAASELVPGKYPTMLYGNSGHSNYLASTFWSEEMWFLKLRNLQIGYTLPKKISKKLYMEHCRVYCLMQNLFSFDNMHKYGIDPENTGTGGTNYPTTRVINIGLNLTF